MSLLPGDLAEPDAVWLAEIGVSGRAGRVAARPPAGLTAGQPLASPTLPLDPASTAPELHVSDRGWIGEPDDADRPNELYAARLLGVPALEAAIPIYPELPRRAAFTAGEILLANGDGALDALAGNWQMSGRIVRLLRGPHRRPRHAPYADMVEVALLRAAGAASGTTRLTIPLGDAAISLDVPACDIYGGTGGADGMASLAGQAKPRLYGVRRQIEPVLEDAGRLIYRLHHGGAIDSVVAVRDRGVALSSAGDVANYAALQAASPAAGTFVTCLADGSFRLGQTPALVTVDARGDTTPSYSSGTAASIATKLLTGPGGLGSGDVAPAAFDTWSGREAGLYLRGGTVAQALDTLAAGIAGWWGADRDGRITGGVMRAPETMTPAWEIQPWMLRAPPEQVVEGIEPPRWRVRLGYQALGRVMSGEDFAGSVSAADREIWSKPYQTATAADLAVLADYPLAVDAPVLVSALESALFAGEIADALLALYAVPRATWRVPLHRVGLAAELGQALRLTWPRHGLAGGRTLLVRAMSVRGDQAELLLWG